MKYSQKQIKTFVIKENREILKYIWYLQLNYYYNYFMCLSYFEYKYEYIFLKQK